MITYGADPEVFIYDYQNKIVVSAQVFANQYKTQLPIKINEIGEITTDGTALEIHPNPSFNYNCLIKNCHKLLHELEVLVVKMNSSYGILIEPLVGNGSNFKLSKENISTFTQRASWDAYTNLESYEKSKDSWNVTRRSGGGHIHIGIKDTDNNYCSKLKTGTITTPEELHFFSRPIIIMMDYFISAQLSILSSKEEFIRRISYGRAGSYRKQKHGLEYRVFSNIILKNNILFEGLLAKMDLLMHWVVSHPFELETRVNRLNKIFSHENIQKLINTGIIEDNEKNNLITAIEEMNTYINK